MLQKMSSKCVEGLSLESHDILYDMLTFTTNMLIHFAKTYRKVSKGSDHWLASESVLPEKVAAPIAKSIDNVVVSQAWAHQYLLNLHSELGKASGGFRTIAKTPKLYRLWVRSRKKVVRAWSNILDKSYDTACKESCACSCC